MWSTDLLCYQLHNCDRRDVVTGFDSTPVADLFPSVLDTVVSATGRASGL